MDQNGMSALIIAKPGRIRDSLRALLRAIPQIGEICQVDDGSTALNIVAKYHPALALLGADLSENELQTLLNQIKKKYPQIWCIVLVETIHQQGLAETAGADTVLFAGFPAAKFFATIEKLLSVEETNHVHTNNHKPH
jgi:DNA-binding NarL/FixJ family response regulator